MGPGADRIETLARHSVEPQGLINLSPQSPTGVRQWLVRDDFRGLLGPSYQPDTALNTD
jgi:hypothetical protein